MSLIQLVGPGELFAIASSITFSVAQTFLRQGMRSVSPLATALIVNGIVSLGGFILSILKGTLLTSKPEAILWYAAVGATGPTIGRYCYLVGVSRMGLSRTVPISSAAPIWGTLLAVLFLGEAPTTMVILGTLGIVVGVSILGIQDDKSQSFKSWFQGALVFPLAASLAYAAAPIFVKLANTHQATPVVGMAVSFATANCILLLTKPILPGQREIKGDKRGFIWVGGAGLIGICSSYMLWTAFTITSVSTALPLSRIAPIWVLILSYFFLGKLETINRKTVLATICVVAGGVLITAFRN